MFSAIFSTIRLTKINLYKHIGSVNFWTPFILALAAVYEMAHPLGELCAKYSIPVNGFSAAFIWTDVYTVFILFLGIFIMFCDLPFKDNQQMFLLSRSGKRVWIFSQVLYVIFMSLAYMVFIFVSFCVVLIPNIAFDVKSWGKIMRSLAATNIGESVNKIKTSANVLEDFTPLEGFAYSFGTAFAGAVVIGLIMLCLNLIVKHNSGIVVSGGLIFFYMLGYMGLGGFLRYYFTPLWWCSINYADKRGISAYPDISWIIAALCIIFAVEIAVMYIFGSKRIKFILDTVQDSREETR